MLEDLTLEGKMEHLSTTIDAIVPEKKGRLVLIGQTYPGSKITARESDSMNMAYFALDILSDESEERKIAKELGYNLGHFYRRADIPEMRRIFSGKPSQDANYLLFARLDNPNRKELTPVNPDNFEEVITRLGKDYKDGFIVGLVQIPDKEILRISTRLREVLKQAGEVKKELAKYA